MTTPAFEDRAALVVSASRGVGYAIAAELARQGASVALTACTEEPLREAARTIRAETGRRPRTAGRRRTGRPPSRR
ncbi:SDR family NAD(P)-dependent oxidoreductase [Streptomyces galilaeus]